ncbi:type IV secretion system DNA-binding domain-containing protein, partial [Vibrio parahaemolyticus]
MQTPQRIKTRAASAVREESAAATASISFAGVRVKALDETKHFKIIGTTGTGKSTVIRELLTAALDRGD